MKTAKPKTGPPSRTRNPASAVVWGVYKVTPEGLELVYEIGRRDEAINADAHEFGFPPYSERLLIAAGWTIGKLRAFVEDAWSPPSKREGSAM